MTPFFLALLVGSAALSWPAWAWGRRKRPQSVWLLFLFAPALVAWIALVAAGIGPQSLSNIVEAIGLAALAVVLAYVKVFVLDRVRPDAGHFPWPLLAVLVVAAMALRLFMPLLPE